MNDTKKLLKSALALIEKRGGWVKEFWYAIRVGKDVIGCDVSEASCFCATGAIYKAAGSRDANARAAISTLRDSLPAKYRRDEFDAESDVVEWNDNRKRTKTEVITAFKKAIAKKSAAA